MIDLFEKYGVSQELPPDMQYAALEKEKQKLLRKLNHVFGNLEKEEELNREMELLEEVMEEMKQSGRCLSLQDVTIHTRELSQRKVNSEEAKRLRIQEMEQRIFDTNPEVFGIIHDLYDIALYYLRQRDFVAYESWLYYGATKGLTEFMNYLYDLYSEPAYGMQDEHKAFYWMKRGAANGAKRCCEAFGDYHANEGSFVYAPRKAVGYYVKAADADHPEAYIKAFKMFYLLGDYKKAAICLTEAEKLSVSDTEKYRKMLAEAN